MPITLKYWGCSEWRAIVLICNFHNIGGSGGTNLLNSMDKIDPFDPRVGSLQDWLEDFEAKAICKHIYTDDRKIIWCKTLIGSTGRKVLASLPALATWNHAKLELRKVLGEDDSPKAAWSELQSYKAGKKSFGEIMTDIASLTRRATTDVALRESLGIQHFLDAIPAKISKEIRKKRVGTLEEAFQEAKFFSKLAQEEEVRKGKVCMLQENDEDLSAAMARLSLQEECKVLQQSDERPAAVRSKRKPDNSTWKCWACGETGHTVKYCKLFRKFQEQRKKQEQSLAGSNGNQLNYPGDH